MRCFFVRSTDSLFGLHQSGHLDEDYIVGVIDKLRDGTTELYFHPAADVGGIPPSAAEQELRRLAREVVPRQSGTDVTVDPLDSIVSRPMTSLGLFPIAFALAVLVCALGHWIVRGEIFAGVFWLAKTSLFASAIFLAAFEFGGAASVTGNGGTTASAATATGRMLPT